MLALLFSVAGTRYALRCSEVREVLPRRPLRVVPCAPPAVAGVLMYRGCAIGVVDLCQMLTGTPCRSAYSSRLVVVQRRLHDGSVGWVGIEVEEVTETVHLDLRATLPNPVCLPDARYLGPLIQLASGWDTLSDEGQVVQLIEAAHLLSPEIDGLFNAAATEQPSRGELP